MKQEKGCEKNESFFTALFFDVGSLHKDLINSLLRFHYCYSILDSSKISGEFLRIKTNQSDIPE